MLRQLRDRLPVSQFGGPFEVLLCLGKGVQVPGTLPGEHQRRERKIDIVRGQRVVSELGINAGAAAGRQAGIFLQGLGEGPM